MDEQMNSSDGLSGVDQLLEEFLDRHQNGEEPTVEEYCQRHPELATEIRDVFEAMMMVEELKPGSQDESGTLGGSVRVDGQRLDQVGDYRILCEIGRGGMGVVYEAEQLSLQRRVALKVLPRQLAGDSKSLGRFQREAKAAARMHHTNIVPVFEVGNDSEHVYYAMQLIQGQSLDLVIDDLTRLRRESVAARSPSSPESSERPKNRPVPSIALSLVSGQFQQEQLGGESAPPSSPSLLYGNGAAETETMTLQVGSTASAMLPGNSDISTAESDRRGYFTSVAHIGQQAASALSYAHSRGIVHRDIKPSNLLLDAAGVVWVTDFGLAKTGDHDLTHTGDILGTIRYMSPERFRGHCDVRADIYSLGLTLYELLTLKPAFVSADQMSLIERIRNTEATPPRSIDSRVPRDLETIILKAIDKDPKHRYQSADEMEEDLQRFIDDEPIQARRISLLERFTRWSRRNRALATSLSAIAVLVSVGFIASTLAAGYFRSLQRETAGQRDAAKLASRRADEASQMADRERNAALGAKRESERQAELTRRNLYLAHINMAQSAARTGDQARLNELLRPWRDNDLRGFEWYYLRSQDRDEHQLLHGHTAEVRSMAWHPDGRRLASGSRDDNTIRIWDVHTNQLLHMIHGHMAGVWGLDWSPDGTRLASASVDRTVRTWNAENGHELSRLSDHGYWVFDVKWSPDGTRLASTSWDGTVRIWDAEDGTQLVLLDHQSELPWSIAWHPDGKRVATGCTSDPIIRIWDSITGEPLQTLRGHLTWVVSLDWHRDGKRLASGGGDGDVFLWDTDSLEQIGEFVGHGAGTIYKLAWSPTRTNRLMTTSDDSTVRLWNTERGIEIHAFKGHPKAVKAGCWSPDGSQFAGGGADSTVRIWDVAGADPEKGSEADSEVVTTFSWSPDGALMAIASSDGTIRINRSRSGQLLHMLSDEEGLPEVTDLQFSPDGVLLASGGKDGVVRWWNTRTGKLVHRSAERHGDQDEDRRVILALAWHPHGIRLVSAGQDSSIRVWDARTGALQYCLGPNDGPTYCLSFSPDGQRLLSGHQIDQPIRVWDTSTWEQVGELDSSGINVHAIKFSPDGRQLAVAGGIGGDWRDPLVNARGSIRVWHWPGPLQDQEAGPEIEIKDLPHVVSKLSWNPDNRRLASAGNNGSVRLWDIASKLDQGMGRELLRWPLFGRWRRELQFSPDGSRLAVVSGGALRVLDAFSGYAREKSPQLLPAIDARILAETTTVDDYRVRAEVYASRGNWSAAEKAYDGYFDEGTVKPWIVAGTWVAGYFQGDLRTLHAPEHLTDATQFDPLKPLPTPSGELSWKSIESLHEATVDFDEVLGNSDASTAYVYYQVLSLREQDVCILFGDNDYHRLWVNGQLVSEDEVEGPAIPNEFAIACTLRRGWNSILAKIVDVEHQHGMFLRLSNQPLELAEAFERTGQYELALSAWDRILQARPDDRRILLRRGANRWRLGDREGAEADLTSFLVDREENVAFLEMRAAMNLQLGRVEEGFEDYDAALQVAPDSRSLWRRCLSAKLSRDRPDEAAELLRYLIKHSPNDHLSHVHLAIVLLELGDVDGYQEVRTEMLTRWGGETSAEVALRTASAALLAPATEAELANAAALATQAAQTRSYFRLRNAEGLAKYRQGVLAASNGQAEESRQFLEQARQTLESAIENSPDDSQILELDTRYTLAMVLHHLGDRESKSALVAAENAFREFQRYTGSQMPYLYMARILRREALGVIMGSSYEQLTRAEQFVAEGQIDTAVELVTRIVEADPEAIDFVRPLFEPQMLGFVALSPTAETRPIEWTYRLTPPQEGWETSTDGEGWRNGKAVFSDHPSARTRLEFDASDVWLRRTFEAPPTTGRLVLRMLYNDNVRVKLNGTLIASRDGSTGQYVNLDCSPDASALLQPGKNILSVHCINEGGSVAIDVGLYAGAGANPMWMNLLSTAIAAKPDALVLVQERGELYVRDERYLEAGRDYATSAPISRTPDVHALSAAALLALSGNAEAYGQYCESLLPTLAAAESPQQAASLIKSCLLMPDAVQPSQLPIHDVIEQLETGADDASWRARAHGTVALWAFRNGDFDVAEERLELAEQSARQANSSGTHDVMQLVFSLRAMIEQPRQSKSFGSPQVLLTQTRDLIDAEIRRESDGTLVGASLIGPDGALNHTVIIAELLCREAERTVSMKPQQNSGKSD